MIATSYEEVHSKAWIAQHMADQTHELIILRQVIPFQKIIRSLRGYYAARLGRMGKDLRLMIALLLLGKLRQLSDQGVIELVQENRYAQYFCNVPDRDLSTFLDRSTICKFRARIGKEGIRRLEHHLFAHLRDSGAISKDTALIDSSALENNILYPNDVLLLYKALGKMCLFARQLGIALWFDEAHIKARWRAFNRASKGQRATFLCEFDTLFRSALKTFKHLVKTVEAPYKKKQNIGCMYSRCSNNKPGRNWPGKYTLKIAWSPWMNSMRGL